jgi:hypothetical protein
VGGGPALAARGRPRSGRPGRGRDHRVPPGCRLARTPAGSARRRAAARMQAPRTSGPVSRSTTSPVVRVRTRHGTRRQLRAGRGSVSALTLPQRRDRLERPVLAGEPPVFPERPAELGCPWVAGPVRSQSDQMMPWRTVCRIEVFATPSRDPPGTTNLVICSAGAPSDLMRRPTSPLGRVGRPSRASPQRPKPPYGSSGEHLIRRGNGQSWPAAGCGRR